MTITLQLSQRWICGSQIGKGGFGQVFEVQGENDQIAAAKLIPKQPGADRELLFDNLSGVRNVVPVIDHGEWNNHWVLVMPRAEKSLREHLTKHGSLTPEETAVILNDLVTALVDLQGKVVHRDIKPDNVLFLNSHWCFSDFGIARYAEASTAPDTHKYKWTKQYNPPERWRDERATTASDIYSLGVMAFEMLSGHRPFQGPDFRTQHLKENPPRLTACPPPLASLVAQCLFKAAESRPTAANLLNQLGCMFQLSSPGASLLQVANQAQVYQISNETARLSAAHSKAEWQKEVFASANQAFEMIVDRFSQGIRENAPAAIWQSINPTSISIKLGVATLTLDTIEKSRETVWGSYKPRFQVIAHTRISVKFPPNRFQYEGRSHSLWFCDAQEDKVFRWYETAFMCSPLLAKRGRQNPFALPPGEDTGKALSPMIAGYDVAWPFTPLEPGNETDFLDRWMTWFAQATQGELYNPSSMPELSVRGSWRE